MKELKNLFSQQGKLSKILTDYSTREGQTEMALDINLAIQEKTSLIIEAGTGIGKTFAYLAPVLMNGKKTIISTGTKTLQDQLYNRDLPLLASVLGRPISTSLLKGRSNYLCLHRLDDAHSSDKTIVNDLRIINEWKSQTDTGDLSELIGISENSGVWPLVTCTNDNCPDPSYDKCYFFKARKLAQNSDLSVINHHLLFADMAMKEEGFFDFLPDAEVIIIDEAHQIADIATQFIGITTSSYEIERIMKELLLKVTALNETPTIKAINNLSKILKKLISSLPRKKGRYVFDEIDPKANNLIRDFYSAIEAVTEAMSSILGKDESLELMLEILKKIRNRMSYIIDSFDDEGLRWIEVTSRSIRLNITPLDIGNRLQHQLNSTHQTWIFTSATITVDDDFSYFQNRLGIRTTKISQYRSPFALDTNALVYVPSNLPETNDIQFTESMLAESSKLINSVKGGILFLFTSNKSLEIAKKWFHQNKNKLNSRSLLIQGESSRDHLLKRFREEENGVLLGTRTFWEGVDVRGQALNMVVIDKLPFKSPADPLVMARLEYLNKLGENGFTEHQLPEAVLSLKQGIGRLLRDENDFGLIIICDNRINKKSYGSVFKKSLEPLEFTDNRASVIEFLKYHNNKNQSVAQKECKK